MAFKHPNIFWDWDGTIANTMPVYFRVFQETHQHFNLPHLSEEHFHKNTATTSQKHFSSLLPEAHVAGAINYCYSLLDKYSDEVQLFPEAQGWLEAAAVLGSRNIIVSNKTHLQLIKDIKRFKLEHLIAAAVGGTELTNHKPHPDHMHLAAQRAGVAVSASDAMVGDSPADYEIAKAAGTYAYLLHSQVYDFKEIIKNNPKASVVSRPLLHKTLFQS